MLSDFTMLINDFVVSELSKVYVNTIEEPIEPLVAILEMNDFMVSKFDKLSEAYSNKEAVEFFYLQYLPSEFITYPDEVIFLHELIVDLYHFLYKQKTISRRKYLEMLDFFQSNKSLFLEKMLDEKNWSKSKVFSLKETAELSKTVVNEEDVFLNNPNIRQLENSFKQIFNNVIASSEHKVIPFPTSPQQLEDTCPVFQLRIDFKGLKPPVWRRLIIPGTFTLSDLHQAIQILFNRKDCHLYRFTTPDGKKFQSQSQSFDNSKWDYLFYSEIQDADTTPIRTILSDYPFITYTFEPDDKWQHKIKIEKVFSLANLAQEYDDLSAEELPYCLKGRGNVPEENNNQTGQYGEFDPELVNNKLKKLKK